MDKPQVYSYLRFSDPKQAAGSSAERQTEYARRWAAERGMRLDDTLSMRDEGLSAYHQRHVKAGALGVFLAAVSEGRIAPGSVLIVEGLDRLSRAEPIQAQAQLAQIINAGITVVTASDGREYNRDGLKAQPMDLVYSLLVMIRAHEESDTKSKRVRAAVRRQCEQWIAGTYRGPIRNGKDPAWVRWTGEGWELIPERVEAMRLAIERFRAGDGGVRIVRELDRLGLQLTAKGSGAPNLYKALKLPALMGTKRLDVDGVTYDLPGYYPALLTADEFSQLQTLGGQRFRRRGPGEIPGLFTGMALAWCGYCGGAILAQNSMSRKRKDDGTPQDGHRRILCANYSRGRGCSVPGSCSIVPIERALMTYCSDQMNLSALLDGSDRAGPIQAELVSTRKKITEAETRLDRVTAALLDDDGPAPAAFARKARELEAAIEKLTAEATALEYELARVARHDTPAAAEQWAELAEGAERLEADARQQIRRLVSDTFERIVIYHRGADPEEEGKRTIDVLLIAKGGTGRMLRIDRRTGEWKAGADWLIQ